MTALQKNMQRILQNKIFQICEFLITTTVPVLLIKKGVVPFDHLGLLSVLSATFIIVTMLIFLRVYYTKSWTFQQIGFTFTGMTKALPAYLFVLLAVLSFFVLAPHFTEVRDGFDVKYFFLYSVFGAILQEILYRSYLMKLGNDIFNNKHICLLSNVIVFTGMHYIFPNFDISFGFIFLAGFVFAKLYEKYSFIFLICVTHVALNYFAYTVKLF